MKEVYVDGGINKKIPFALAKRGQKISYSELCCEDEKRYSQYAELIAILMGTKMAKEGDIVLSDNKPLVYLLNGKKANIPFSEYKIKIIKRIEKKNLRLIWVPRKFNKAGKLINIIMKKCQKREIKCPKQQVNLCQNKNK